MSSVFLSHNSKDKPWVRRLAERLSEDGVLVWLDEAEINIGDSLIEKIAAGIQDMKFVAAVISNNSINSSWVQKEINLAMTKEVAGRQVTVLPLLIEKCTLPASLTDKLYADFTNSNNYEAEYSKLLCALGITAKTEVSQPNLKKAIKAASSTPATTSSAEIKIIGINKERTRQDPEFSGLQDYYLQLSEQPPPEWRNFFKQSRQFPRHSMWRDAWVENDCVVIKCAIDELTRYHVKDLKEDVATANRTYLQAKNDAEQKYKFEQEKAAKLKKERDDILDQIDFE